MLVRAIAAVKANEPEAIARFNHNDPEFRDRDLFVFCFNRQDGKFTAHEAMVKRDVRTFRDKKGTAYGKQMYDVATKGQMSEVAYFAPFPGSTEQVAKRALSSPASSRQSATGVSQATIFRSIRRSWDISPRSWPIWAPHKFRAAWRSARNSWRW
jgi:hypothetical protein